MKDPPGFVPPHGNYSQLQSYRKAEVVYDLTIGSVTDFFLRRIVRSTR